MCVCVCVCIYIYHFKINFTGNADRIQYTGARYMCQIISHNSN